MLCFSRTVTLLSMKDVNKTEFLASLYWHKQILIHLILNACLIGGNVNARVSRTTPVYFAAYVCSSFSRSRQSGR